jgi:hypothetical protein
MRIADWKKMKDGVALILPQIRNPYFPARANTSFFNCAQFTPLRVS